MCVGDLFFEDGNRLLSRIKNYLVVPDQPRIAFFTDAFFRFDDDIGGKKQFLLEEEVFDTDDLVRDDGASHFVALRFEKIVGKRAAHEYRIVRLQKFPDERALGLELRPAEECKRGMLRLKRF